MSQVYLAFSKENSGKSDSNYIVCDASTGKVYHDVIDFPVKLPSAPKSWGGDPPPVGEDFFIPHV
jgi:hypothetical protein